MPIQKPPNGDGSKSSSSPSSSKAGSPVEKPSALERYLAKKKAEERVPESPSGKTRSGKASTPSTKELQSTPSPSQASQVREEGPSKFREARLGEPAAGTRGLDEAERNALELGVPIPPPPGGKAGVAPNELILASFIARWVALIVDALILGALHSAVMSFAASSFGVVLGRFYETMETSLSRLLLLGIVYAYYGWFYSQKGASPGKLLMGLQVVKSDTGRFLTYWQAFFRESIGKLISGLVLGFGFLIAAFRADHRALHDMIFDTRVIEKPRRRPDSSV